MSRYIDASPDKVWEVMTTRIEEWWCPKPWRAELVEQQWRAGCRPGSHCTHTEVYGEGFDPVSPESVIEIWVPVDPPGTLDAIFHRGLSDSDCRPGSHCSHTEVYGEGFDPGAPESVIEIWVPVDPP